MNATTKKVLKIIGNVVIWLIVAFAILTTIFAFAARNGKTKEGKEGIATLGKKCFLIVESDSMVPVFKTGDLLFSRYIEGTDKALELQVGDVITYHGEVNGKPALITHRITEVDRSADGKKAVYTTKGDNNGEKDAAGVHSEDVVAVWGGHKIGGLGKFMNFLNTPLGFGLFIVLPMLLFFAYELYRFIAALVAVKNTGKKQITAADEELIKQKAVEEYLRQQAAANAAAEEGEAPAEEAPAEAEQENKEE